MRRSIAISVMMLAMGVAGQASAEDRLLDLRQPSVVVTALRDAGYKAELKTNSKGEPYVLSSANGSDFTIEFYGCKGQADCSSYQFASWYKAEPLFTVEFANQWNAAKRFLKVSIDKDGNLDEYMDFTAVGKTTQANFADIVDWYQVMDTSLAKFIAEKREK